MVRYGVAAAALVAVLLVLFGIFEAAGAVSVTDPEQYLNRGGVLLAAGIILLIADVVLPVPSSVVMVAHGALFGSAIGAAASLVGAVGAAVAGYAIGSKGGPLMARAVDDESLRRSEVLFDRWGELAIVSTRPLPILAEATSILAGVAGLGWRRLLRGAIVGSLPPAVLYAIAGAHVADAASGLLVFGGVALLAVITFVVGRRWGHAA